MKSSIERVHRRITKDRDRKEFENLDERALSRMTDIELAEWQSQKGADSPQRILAQNEWNRRLVVEQMRNTRFSAYIGLIGIIVGALLGWLLSSDYSPLPSNEPQQETEQNAYKDLQRDDPQSIPIQPQTKPVNQSSETTD